MLPATNVAQRSRGASYGVRLPVSCGRRQSGPPVPPSPVAREASAARSMPPRARRSRTLRQTCRLLPADHAGPRRQGEGAGVRRRPSQPATREVCWASVPGRGTRQHTQLSSPLTTTPSAFFRARQEQSCVTMSYVANKTTNGAEVNVGQRCETRSVGSYNAFHLRGAQRDGSK